MKRFIIEQSDEEFYTLTSGISLVGLGLNRFTTLVSLWSTWRVEQSDEMVSPR